MQRIRKWFKGLRAGPKVDLAYLLSNAEPDIDFAARVEWAAALVQWLRSSSKEGPSPIARLRFMLNLLERNPQWKEPSARRVRSLLRETRTVRLFTEVGLSSQTTFGREFRQRLLHTVIPRYLDPHSLAGVQARIFYDEDDAAWLNEIDEKLWHDLLAWLRTGIEPGEYLFPNWPEALWAAMRVLAARALAISLREEVAYRSPEFTVARNPLARVHDELGDLGSDPERWRAEHFDALREGLAEGRRLIQAVRNHTEQFGISVDLVYQLDRMRHDLNRLQRILRVFEVSPSLAELKQNARNLWIELLRGHERDGDFGAVLTKHLGLLSRKIVERTGHTGEHYITRTRGEYWHMFFTACAGGALTAITAFLKYAFNTGRWPPFFEFLYLAGDFSISFLIMHFFGFKLATKQPSMTAAALAGQLKGDARESEDDAFVDEIARIARSQFAAVAGNIIAVIPCAIGINLLYQTLTGHHFFSEAQGHHFLESIHPLFSGTLLFGSVTGILLWLSSMSAGWLENASVYLKIPDLIRGQPTLRALLGQRRAAKLAEAYLENVSGVVGSIALGCLLAATPLLGHFFGFPLMAHHVTLSTGAATYSILGLPEEILTPELFVATGAGILLIGFLNFGVSFAMALMIALRARDVPAARVRGLFRKAGRRLVRQPWQFMLPPPKGAEKSEPAP